MRLLSYLFVVLLFSSAFSCESAKEIPEEEQVFMPSSTEELFSHWKDNLSENKLKSYTFIQETVRYENGAVKDTGIWHEIIEYPNFFRIDLGTKEEANTNLYRNDSLYVLRAGNIVHTGKQIQEFLITEGALYKYPIDSTLSLLSQVGIDHSLFDTIQYKGSHTYIVGAKQGDLTKVQIWLDAEERFVVRRFMKLQDESLLEVTFDNFQLVDGHLIETWLEFFKAGELIQTERYYDINVNPELDPRVFDPVDFPNYYWW